MNLNVIIGVGCALLGASISYATFMRNKRKDDNNDGHSKGVMLSEIGYIKANTDEIKIEQREQRKTNTEFVTRLTAVEASAKQAHLRIDRLECGGKSQ